MPPQMTPLVLAHVSGVTKAATGYVPVPIGSRTFRPLASRLSGMGDVTDLTQEAQDYKQKIESFLGWFGTGRAEADIIAPVQNALDAIMDGITQKILTGMNPSLAELQEMFKTLKQSVAYYYQFVTDPRFTDGRASEQGLNTMMPLVDGTCGYHHFAYVPTQFNCISWGTGTIGGPGTNGQMGALQRAIIAAGGTATIPAIGTTLVPPLNPPVLGGLGTTGAVLLGVLAIYLFSRRSGR